MLLSIIIPCYNVGDYIYKCLESALTQIDEQVEIIIINDGSTDNSDHEIRRCLDDFKPCNVKYITQSNRGVAATRNAGLDNVTGNYIGFLDGDDLLCSAALKELLPILSLNKYDIVEFDALRFGDHDSSLNSELKITNYSGAHEINSISDLLPVFKANKWYLWGRIYKSALFQGQRFEINRRYEDIILLPYLYLSAKSIFSMQGKQLYRYRQNFQGITRKPISSDIDDMLFAMNKMYDYVSNNGDSDMNKIISPTLEFMFITVGRLHRDIYGYRNFSANTIAALKKSTMHSIYNFKLKNKFKIQYIRMYKFLSQTRSMAKMLLN